jgi:hypothetical protein
MNYTRRTAIYGILIILYWYIADRGKILSFYYSLNVCYFFYRDETKHSSSHTWSNLNKELLQKNNLLAEVTFFSPSLFCCIWRKTRRKKLMKIIQNDFEIPEIF